MTKTGTEGKTAYELAYLMSPLLPQDGVLAEVASLKKAIETHGGTGAEEEQPRMRYLAYTVVAPIANKKNSFDEAYFGWMRFWLAPAEVSAIEALLKKNDAFIRTLLTVVPKDSPEVVRDEATKTGEAKEVVATKEKTGLTEQELDREIDHLIGEDASRESAAVSA